MPLTLIRKSADDADLADPDRPQDLHDEQDSECNRTRVAFDPELLRGSPVYSYRCHLRHLRISYFRLGLLIAVSCVVLRGVAHGAEHEYAAQAAAPTSAILFDNLGNYHHPVTTRSPRAQEFFDQGLRLIYGFNHDEATKAFAEAARIDPGCAMAQWGIAFAFGPNYNLPRDGQRDRAAYAAVQRARALAPDVSQREQDYIAALALRYAADPYAEAKSLDRAFADAMRELARAYPDDLDAATLFAESMMDLRPWDLWMPDGRPQPGTDEIVATLEGVLARNPNHPGANHYYIHAIEASRTPEKGVAAAARLPRVMPGAGHLVHMPSHIYMRVGRYADASAANRDAIVADQRYLERARPEGVYPMMYVPHNVHFLWAAASMEGRSAEAIAAARQLTPMLSAEMMRSMPMLEYFAPTESFALARFGRWEEILVLAEPAEDLAYAKGMWRYARGLALAATGQFEAAQAEQAAVVQAAAAMPAERIVGDNTPAATALRLAAEVLAGEIATRRGEHQVAIPHLEEAIRLQDGLPYTEPPPWYFPTRQALGATLLAAGRSKDAEAIYREDLQRNPQNGWSLYGLAQSLRTQGDRAGARAVDKQFKAAWSRADVELIASRF